MADANECSGGSGMLGIPMSTTAQAYLEIYNKTHAYFRRDHSSRHSTPKQQQYTDQSPVVLSAAALVALPVGEDGQHLFGAGKELPRGHSLLVILLDARDESGGVHTILALGLGEVLRR